MAPQTPNSRRASGQASHNVALESQGYSPNVAMPLEAFIKTSPRSRHKKSGQSSRTRPSADAQTNPIVPIDKGVQATNSQELTDLWEEINRTKTRASEADEARSSADAVAKKATTELQALRKELEETKKQAKDTETARDSENDGDNEKQGAQDKPSFMRAIFEFTCCSIGVGLVCGIIELVFIFVCKQDAQCNWAGKATKKSTEVLLYAMAGIRWILAYFGHWKTGQWPA